MYITKKKKSDLERQEEERKEHLQAIYPDAPVSLPWQITLQLPFRTWVEHPCTHPRTCVTVL